MKKILIVAFLMAAINTASFSREFVAGGKTHTPLGDYRVEVADNPVIINNQELKTFIISYENSPMVVKVAIMKGKKCKDYIVISDKLCIKYVCTENYFGVEKLKGQVEGLATSDTFLNRSEYFHQKVLTPGQQNEIENTMIIAAFFPRLING